MRELEGYQDLADIVQSHCLAKRTQKPPIPFVKLTHNFSDSFNPMSALTLPLPVQLRSASMPVLDFQADDALRQVRYRSVPSVTVKGISNQFHKKDGEVESDQNPVIKKHQETKGQAYS